MHLKLDTGMGRWGLSELPAPPREVVGLMTHLATADTDPAFARAADRALPRRRPSRYSHLTRHVANSAAALRLPESRFDAARCGIALYGLSPFGDGSGRGRARAGALVAERARAGEAARSRARAPATAARFVAERPTWIGIVPVGYADGFRRDLTGTEVRVGGEPRRVVGTVSMDAFAVELDRELPVGDAGRRSLGHGVLAEEHARVAGTITYELACGIDSRPASGRDGRTVVDA